ncbi:MAG TPA: alpha/beta hydrolase, partial [Novosphingobium sp.]|nr:alpha/beta hydrolase [Novosphingobium sp.]
PPAYARALAAMMPGAQVSQLLMPDVGHYPPLEVPRRFARAMASWIEDTAPQAPRAPAPADR